MPRHDKKGQTVAGAERDEDEVDTVVTSAVKKAPQAKQTPKAEPAPRPASKKKKKAPTPEAGDE